LVSAKESLVGQWRGLSSKTVGSNGSQEQKDQLAKLAAQVREADAKIREAAQPKSHSFELVLSKPAKLENIP
jgi:hypothetical protein